MGTKGRSNLYGGGIHGKPTEHINYKFAKYLSNNHYEDHVTRHGAKEMGLTESQYKGRAIFFANNVDRVNYESFVKINGTTLKFDKATSNVVMILKDGTITNYYKSNINWWNKEKEKNGK